MNKKKNSRRIIAFLFSILFLIGYLFYLKNQESIVFTYCCIHSDFPKKDIALKKRADKKLYDQMLAEKTFIRDIDFKYDYDINKLSMGSYLSFTHRTAAYLEQYELRGSSLRYKKYLYISTYLQFAEFKEYEVDSGYYQKWITIYNELK